MLDSIFEKHRICSNRTKSLLIVNFTSKEIRILHGTAFCYLTSPFCLQCFKPQHNSFKIVFDLLSINAIDLHNVSQNKNSFHKERTCAHLELKDTKNITHFLMLKLHSQ